MMLDYTRNLINGEWTEAASGGVIDVIDPATGDIHAQVAGSDADDVASATAAARSAFEGTWGAFSAERRGAFLLRLAATLRQQTERLAAIESRSTGKPLHQARADIEIVARYFHFYGGAADKLHGEIIPSRDSVTVLLRRVPLGVVASIIPWNYPAQIFARSVAAALAAGNAVVLKPAPEACLSVLEMTQLLSDAGLPPGTLNVVVGSGAVAGTALVSHPDINHISFTGSTATGARIQELAARNNVPATMELGGKSPHIVFADADLDKAARVIAASCIQHAGQTCSAGTRVLVEYRAWDELIDRLAKIFNESVAGPPSHPADCGPVMGAGQVASIESALTACLGSGAAVLARGRISDHAASSGFYVAPVLIGAVKAEDRLFGSELFGPVLAATPFANEDEAVALANATQFGLVAAIWTARGDRQLRLAGQLRCGQVFVNGYGAAGGVELPFGGVKRSGYGREKGFAGLLGFTTTQTVVIEHG